MRTSLGGSVLNLKRSLWISSALGSFLAGHLLHIYFPFSLGIHCLTTSSSGKRAGISFPKLCYCRKEYEDKMQNWMWIFFLEIFFFYSIRQISPQWVSIYSWLGGNRRDHWVIWSLGSTAFSFFLGENQNLKKGNELKGFWLENDGTRTHTQGFWLLVNTFS